MKQPETIHWSCDVLVVGAGPAGSMAARCAAQEGLSVIMLERRMKVGVPVRCAEFAPRMVARYLPLNKHCVHQKITAMDTVLPDGKHVGMKVNGIMVRRDRFDAALVEKAVSAGAELRSGIKALEVKERGLSAVGSSGNIDIQARVIVGADGPLSRVGRSVGCINTKLMTTAQYRMPLRKKTDHTAVYFHPYIVGGYGWVFPKNGEADVGVGVEPGPGRNPRKALNQLVQDLIERGVIGTRILGTTGGYLPVGGLIRPWKDRVILAGDAAGTCHPITGAGMYNALVSGEMAGHAAAEAVRAGNNKPLRSYARDLAGLLGSSLARAAARRRSMVARWYSNDFIENITQSWIAFEDYYLKKRRHI